MRGRIQAVLAILTVSVAAVSVAPDAAGQAVPAKKPAAGGVPRTPDGHPDLQGTYDLATLTPLQRAAGQPLVMTPAVALAAIAAARTSSCCRDGGGSVLSG